MAKSTSFESSNLAKYRNFKQNLAKERHTKDWRHAVVISLFDFAGTRNGLNQFLRSILRAVGARERHAFLVHIEHGARCARK